MRAFITVSEDQARQVLNNGFTDLYSLGDRHGVYADDRPLGDALGFERDVELLVEVPSEVFQQYRAPFISVEVPSEVFQQYGAIQHGTRRALIPAEVLNRHRPVRIYNHACAGMSRKQLLSMCRKSEEEGPAENRKEYRDVKEFIAKEARDTIEFFDEIGWLTPVKLQEQQSQSSTS